jgi:hypothetical protein
MKRAYGLLARLYGGGPGIDGGLAIQKNPMHKLSISSASLLQMTTLPRLRRAAARSPCQRLPFFPGVGRLADCQDTEGNVFVNHEGGQFSTLIFEITASSARQNQIRSGAKRNLNHPVVNLYRYRLTKNLICG